MFTVAETAKRLGISRSKVYQLAARREIAHYRIDGKILFTEDDILSYLKACRVEREQVETPAPHPQAVASDFTVLDGARLREAWQNRSP